MLMVGAKGDLTEQAVAVAKKLPEPVFRTAVLSEIASTLATAGAKTKDSKLINQVVAEAKKLPDSEKPSALLSIASVLVAAGEKAERFEPPRPGAGCG